LTIEPGVVVKFDAVDTGGGYYGYYPRLNIIVNGTLNLQGTSSQKIIFTSSRDDMYGGDTNGDGAASTAAAGNWGYIQYTNPSNVLHDAVIRYGGLGGQYGYGGNSGPQMVWMAGSGLGTFEVRDCVLEYAYDKAIYAESLQAPWVHNNTIRNCQTGILATSATVEDNSFSSCSNHGVELGTGVVRRNTITGSNWAIYMTGTVSGAIVSDNTLTNNIYPIYQGPGDIAYSNNMLSSNTNSVIGVGGAINGSVTWEKIPGLVYLVTSDVTIPFGETLTIEPGVVVKFDAVDTGGGYYGYYPRLNIIVNGTLNLQGTSS